MLNDSIFENIYKHYPKIRSYHYSGRIHPREEFQFLKKVEFALRIDYKEEPKDLNVRLCFCELVLKTHFQLLHFLTYKSFYNKGLRRGKITNQTALDAIDDFFEKKNQEYNILIDDIFSEKNRCNILGVIEKTISIFESGPYESYFSAILPQIEGFRGERFFKTLYRSFRLQTDVTKLRAMYKRMVKQKYTTLEDALEEFFDEFFLLARTRFFLINKFLKGNFQF